MWVQIIFYVATTILAYLLTPKPKSSNGDVPTPQDGGSPTALTSGQIRVVFGTVWISPNVAWYGDLSTTPIKECAEGGSKK